MADIGTMFRIRDIKDDSLRAIEIIENEKKLNEWLSYVCVKIGKIEANALQILALDQDNKELTQSLGKIKYISKLQNLLSVTAVLSDSCLHENFGSEFWINQTLKNLKEVSVESTDLLSRL